MNKSLLLIVLLAVVLLSGCVEPPTECGNGVCEVRESPESCPEDCTAPPPETHFECQAQACVEVQGQGTDECATDADCQQCEPPSDPLIREKMVWDLPELCGFTFGGGVEELSPSHTHADIRYLSPEDNDQHSEFALDMFGTVEEASTYFGEPNQDNLKIINGNKIFESVIGELPIGNQRMAWWLSGNNVIRSWNGNDLGTIIDDTLFDMLVLEYLEKYSSTYECGAECQPSGGQIEISVAAIKLQRADYSLENLEAKVNALVAAQPAIDLIVTPEYFFYDNFKQDPVLIDCQESLCTVTSIGTEKSDIIKSAVEFLQEIAVQNNANIVFGTIAERIDIDGADVSISTQLIIDNGGSIIGKHRATKKAEFYTENVSDCEQDMDFCNKIYAAQMETVNTFTLSNANGDEFEVIPVICGEKNHADFIDALAGSNAVIAALSELDQDCDYEETTRRIQGGDNLLDLPDNVCAGVIADIMQEWTDKGLLKQNGYWLVSNGGPMGQIGIISWSNNMINDLEITDDYIYGKINID